MSIQFLKIFEPQISRLSFLKEGNKWTYMGQNFSIDFEPHGEECLKGVYSDTKGHKDVIFFDFADTLEKPICMTAINWANNYINTANMIK